MAIIEDRFGGRKKKEEETDFNGGRTRKKRIVGDGTMSGTGSTGTGNGGGTAFDGSRTRQKRIVGNGTMSKPGSADGWHKTSEIGTDRTTPKQIETFKRYMKQKDDAAKLEKAQNWYKQQKQKQQEQKLQQQKPQQQSSSRQKIEAVFANTLSKERIKKWKANNKK